MRIIRTFHPIGQGAFYSERFYDESECRFNVVFDCGTLNVENNHKKIVRQAFTKDDTIDYLFISHLDEDHISLVTKLRDSVSYIRKVVLPYISPENVVIHKILSQSLGLMEVYGFWTMVYDAIEGGSSNDTNFIFVYPENEDGGRVINDGRGFVYSGKQLTVCSDWMFVPYNKHIERKDDLEEKLRELIQNVAFQNALNQIGVTINSIDDLKEKITSAGFVDMVSSQVIKKSLRKVYHDLSGTINQNSLLVYSGPIANEHKFVMRDRPFHLYGFKPWLNVFSTKVACLYTGDSDLDMKGYKQEFQTLWTNVGTIQLPHHGSYASFQFDKNKNEFNDRYVFPVSCGETNSYGHPSSKVLDFLMANDCLPVVVTENASTRYSQVIVGRP